MSAEPVLVDEDESLLHAVDLRCESAPDPLGVGTASPRLSWFAVGGRRGVRPVGYQVVVGRTSDLLQSDMSTWDSGQIVGGAATGVRVGVQLEGRTRYYWTVRLQDERGRWGPYAPVARFETAILDPAEWQASWIACSTNRPRPVAPLFRTQFTLPGAVVAARAYVTGLGYYELYLNGSRVGSSVLDPGWTGIDKRVLYAVHDVSALLRPGENAVGLQLGIGRFDSPPGSNGRARAQLLFQLHISLGDTEIVVRSDAHSGWIATPDGPILDHSIYDGETYDARQEMDGWASADFPADPVSWRPVVVVEPPVGVLQAQPCEAIEVINSLDPVAITEPAQGVAVYDFGQNFSGWARIAVKGAAGSRVVLRYAEMVDGSGLVNQANLRTARASDTFILRGSGAVEVYEPHFTCHGFRYVQVEGLAAVPDGPSVVGRFVRSAVEQVGRFHSSNAFLNTLHDAIVRTEASNLHSIPTDCPQRDERLGWLNDMAVRADEAICNFDLRRLYAKWVQDIEDTQGDITGAIADTAPWVRHGARPADPVSVSFLLVPWLIYQYYGDDTLIRRHRAGHVRWFGYLAASSRGGLLDYSRYGDWAPPLSESAGMDTMGAGAISAATPGGYVSSAFFYYTAVLLARSSEALGLVDEAVSYASTASSIRQAINERYFDADSGNYVSGNQACNALALAFGLPPSAQEPRVLQNLVDEVNRHGVHVATGNLTTKLLIDALTDHGEGDLAWRLVTQTTYPSWGYMLGCGATTIWERWENVTGGELSAMGSHNHPMFAAVGSWFYTHLGGIDLRHCALAESRLRIRPHLLGDLTDVECGVQTGHGPVDVRWKRYPGRLELDVGVPVGREADVELPVGDGKAVVEESGRAVFTDGGAPVLGRGIRSVVRRGATVRVHVGSGRYLFVTHGAGLNPREGTRR